ncbi:leucyl aminopeptidase family protein [Intrasporangium sp.]|uniref:M17 family metallopeptidase n=1 Tax=Intrasporangium sp. TaxID=1925024 RepID=UPI0032218F08
MVPTTPGQTEHLTRDQSGTTLHGPAPGWGVDNRPGRVPAPEAIHRWAREVGRRLQAHAWARGGDTFVDVTALTDSGLPLARALRLACLGLTDGLGGPAAATGCRIHLVGLPDAPGLAEARSRAYVDARAAQLARDLIDTRANEVTPKVLAGRAVETAERSGLSTRVWDAADAAAAGMGGIIAVGSGSPNPPALVELIYQPAGGEQSRPPVCLVGKGVTFDSGGLSMKSPAAMVGMHSDKAGAVTVLAAMSALRDLGVGTPVRALLPLAENLPGTRATRPGDIITMLDGARVEVVDTDFEGRVLMADALVLAAGTQAGSAPAAVIDVATLTYQAVTALGVDIGALIARDDTLGQRLLTAAERVGEPLWPLPWAPRYADQIRSRAPGARLRNHPGTDTGRALTAALFLGAFVPDKIPWAHLDIAGPAMAGTSADARATGYGVRTLTDLLEQWQPLP